MPLEQYPTHGPFDVIITPQMKVVIYGRKVTSIYPEDIPSIEAAEVRGRIMGEWFSEACPEGELGSNSAEATIEISEQEFLDAYARGWK